MDHVDSLSLDDSTEQPVVSITGIFGSGKTQLAVDVVHSVIEDFSQPAFWLTVSSQLRQKDENASAPAVGGTEKEAFKAAVMSLQLSFAKQMCPKSIPAVSRFVLLLHTRHVILYLVVYVIVAGLFNDTQETPKTVKGWNDILERGARHCLLVLDKVWDKGVLEAFVGIGHKVRILLTTGKQGLWPGARTVVLKPGDGMWRHRAVAMKLLALHAFGQDIIPEGYQVHVAINSALPAPLEQDAVMRSGSAALMHLNCPERRRLPRKLSHCAVSIHSSSPWRELS